MILKNKISISIFIIWLFNISGILGILSTYSDWFLRLTPINLSMYVILILWNIDDFSKKVLVAFSIPFVIGFLTEFLGVNFGLIFGSYSYGDNLGLKIAGVPLIICLNWAVLTIITADLSLLIHKNDRLKQSQKIYYRNVIRQLTDKYNEISFDDYYKSISNEKLRLRYIILKNKELRYY